jgi:glycosyltransferase involved in cell wall biosynthesis
MRVLAMLHLAPPAHNAGAEMMSFAMFRALVERGHEVDVVLSQVHDGITEPYDYHGIHVWPHRGKDDPFRFLASSDVVVTHLENTPRATVLAGVHKLPVVHLLHNTLEPTRRWIRPNVIAVYNSQWMRQDFTDWYAARGREAPRGIVVHPPVRAADYATIPGGHVTLINMYEPKGSRTFWALAERMPETRFLAVVGAYGLQDLRDLPNVEIVPHTSNARDDIYSRTRVLLAPSSYESWGRVGVEAMASGIPVLAHPAEGLLESLGEAGTFVDRDDIDGWERELRLLLDGRRWKTASRKALARSAELDPTEDLEAWCALMEEVTSHGARRLIRA